MRFRRSVLTVALVSCLLAWPALAQTPGSGKRLYANSWALVVGINRYRSSKIPRLEYAEADARAVAKAIVHLGFPKRNIRLLLGPKATRDEVIRVLEEDLNPKMGENDRLFLYFSGHGATTKIHGEQTGYLLPHDARVFDWPSRERPFMSRAPARTLDMHTLMAKIKNLQPRHKLVAVDACFSGYAARSKAINVVGITPRRLERWLSEPVIQILTAGRAGQQAIEKGSYGHGVFTWHLLKGLVGNADEAGGGKTPQSSGIR